MKFKDLEAYRAVMTTGSTQAASELLGISQSAISRRITQLEEDLEVALFVREGARLVPSRINHLLEGCFSDVLERVHILNEVAQNIRSGRHSNAMLRVAVPPGICRRILPAIIAEFLKIYPEIRFEILHGTYDVIHRFMEEKTADIGFIRLPIAEQGFVLSDTIMAHSVCVMEKGHPLAKLKVIRPEDLRNVPLVLLGWRRAPRHDLELAFSAHGVKPVVRLEAHSVSSACGFSAQGIGVSIVNSLLVQECLDLDIEVRSFIPNIPHHFAFIYPERPNLSEIGTEFVEFATVRLQEMADRL